MIHVVQKSVYFSISQRAIAFRLSDLVTFKHLLCFNLALKQEKRAISNYTIVHTRLQLMWIESVLPVVGDFLFWLVIFFGLVLSLELQIELSGIH